MEGNEEDLLTPLVYPPLLPLYLASATANIDVDADPSFPILLVTAVCVPGTASKVDGQDALEQRPRRAAHYAKTEEADGRHDTRSKERSLTD